MDSLSIFYGSVKVVYKLCKDCLDAQAPIWILGEAVPFFAKFGHEILT